MSRLEILATAICIVAVLSYSTSGVLFIKQKKKLAYAFAVIGWVANLGIFIKNWYINGYPPFASMYQILSDISLLFVIMMLFVTMLAPDHGWIAQYFCFGAAIPLIGTLFMDRNMRWSLIPALRSPYFVPHVFSYVLSYSLCTVAFLLILFSFLKKKQRDKYEGSAYFVMRIAFPFMVLGLLLGALWADQVWGNYWTWDIKEVWSLITVAFYSCYFHANKVPKMRKCAPAFLVIGFMALIFTFLCVNVLPNVSGSMHTYT
jgi:ABC-type transport system involved in cytochrome c biogenesis permease subunit